MKMCPRMSDKTWTTFGVEKVRLVQSENGWIQLFHVRYCNLLAVAEAIVTLFIACRSCVVDFL